MTVRVRFAPSPTGALHIGSARTALLNLLFARRHGGQYLLRIEDTDRTRSTPEAVQGIMDALGWLGLLPDEPPVLQSTRMGRHAEVARELLGNGGAYLAYDTPEELDAMRAAAASARTAFKYDGTRWKDGGARPPADELPVVRLRARNSGETVVDDLVQGVVRVRGSELDDMILLRADGTPTYLLSVVVDDHDMGITHVIRGDDHLTNTFRQLGIYEGMGWEPPRFAHVPLVHGADGAKLSKRHGAVSALEYREQGYLPWALCNALLRMGWGHSNQEVFSRAEAETLFDLGGMGRAAACLDPAKMLYFSTEHLRRHDPTELAHLVVARLEDHCAPLQEGAGERILGAMPELVVRARTLVELETMARPLAVRPPAVAVDEAYAGMLKGFSDHAEAMPEWDRTALGAMLKDAANSLGVKLRDLAEVVRLALTGSRISPPLDVIMHALGKAETMERLRRAMSAAD